MIAVLFAATVKLEKSTYIDGVAELKQFGRSLINIKNNNGPKMELCGIPHLIGLSCERWPFTKIRTEEV